MIRIVKPDLPEFRDYLKLARGIWQSHHLTNNGPLVRRLEEKLSHRLQTPYVVLTANGTLALQLLFKALNLKGEVITAPLTFAATTTSLLWEGLTPVFADVNPETFNVNPKDVGRKITKKTRAILAVHLYGNPSDVEALDRIAKKRRIPVIYDGAHAFGVRYRKKSVFSYGNASILSFHATKVFHTIEGGAILTKDRRLAERLRLMRNFGLQGGKSKILGINAKMHEFEAAMGLINLKKAGGWIGLRKKRYNLYRKLLGKSEKITFQKITASRYNYAYFPLCFASREIRERIEKKLNKAGIEARSYYAEYYSPLAVRFGKNRPKGVPVAKGIASRILCLPLYPGLSLSNVRRIADLVEKAL